MRCSTRPSHIHLPFPISTGTSFSLFLSLPPSLPPCFLSFVLLSSLSLYLPSFLFFIFGSFTWKNLWQQVAVFKVFLWQGKVKWYGFQCNQDVLELIFNLMLPVSKLKSLLITMYRENFIITYDTNKRRFQGLTLGVYLYIPEHRERESQYKRN